MSKKIFFILNFFLRSAKNVELEVLNSQIEYKEGFFKKVGFVSIAYVSGFFFSFSTTFLYYLSFYYPDKILTLVSYSQILNMVGAMLLLLLIDPKLMSSIDKGVGSVELKLLTTSRILVHVTLIIILLFIKWI
ncbi:hypothetical protein SL054_002212 [Flavobacterium psychrophilum]|nr:hypothetical protein [Flavobacterium psychrophilum]